MQAVGYMSGLRKKRTYGRLAVLRSVRTEIRQRKLSVLERSKTMLKEKIGVVLFALGVMMADSKCLIVPIALAILGAVLIATTKGAKE